MSTDFAVPVAVGVGFAQDLRRYGSQLAVVGPQGERLTYRELADRVDERRAELGAARKLVLVAGSNDVEPLITYLAALAGSHPVLLADPDNVDSLAAIYDPDVVVRSGQLHVVREESAHELHPELALLLSTSGSTGSPKLVRLSAENVQANAAAIADYLGIRPTDRAATSLPMQYCYGLSVINSNLLRGAGLLLTGDSVIDERFWSTMREHGGTSLHGVPYTFELLARAGFADRELPALRYVTQAGGRLAPERVRAFAELGERRGWQFYVMYGQTEATARMAYLPPELAARRPDTIGVPVPGGSFELAEPDAEESELLYRGPNVMLGYATCAADLALARTTDVLATGDIARRAADGLWEITGRASRFAKVCGLRVDLDQLERVLADAGVRAACTSDDDTVVVGYLAGLEPSVVRRLVCERLGVPADRMLVSPLPELPRLATGKVDYPAVRRLVRLQDLPTPSKTAANDYQPGRRDALKDAFSAPWRRRGPASVREIYARVLHRDASQVRADDTFVGLGGDSLHYVQASLQLEQAVGELPAGWPTTLVGVLERLEPRRRRLAAVETNIVLRAAAIVLVVGTHMGLFTVLGGAHLLLVLAGWSFARFCLPQDEGSSSRRILRSTARVAIPSMVWIAWRATSQWDTGVASALLVSGYAGPPLTIAYWFIEVLVHILLLLSLLYAVPAVRRFDQRHALAVPLLVLAVGYVLRLATLQPPGEVQWWLTHQVLWLFALGWLAQRTSTWPQRLGVLAVAALMLSTYFTGEPRIAIVLGGLALVLALPRIRLPRPLARVVGVLAAASLYIYLTHYALIPQTTIHLGPLAATLIGLGLGVVMWLAVEFAARKLSCWRPGRSRASSPSSV